MKIDASSLRLVRPEILKILKELKVGETLKGRVLEALENSMLIRSAGGEVFTAVLQDGARIPKGAFVELLIKGIDEGKVFAELKSEDSTPDTDKKVSELLRQLGLPVDEKNTEAAKLLLKYRLPLDKEAISVITGLKKSIDNLNQSSGERVGLMLSGLDIRNTEIDALNRILLNWTEGSAAIEKAACNEAGTVVSGDGLQESKKNEMPIPVIIQAESENNEKEAGIKIKAEDISKVIPDNNKETAGYVKTDGKEEAGTAEKSLIDNLGNSRGSELIKVLDGMGIETGRDIKLFAAQVENILASISNTDMEAITYLVAKDMEITPKNLGMLLKNIENEDVVSQFLDKLQNKIMRENNPNLRTISESIRKVFLKPRQIEDSEEVSRQLKDLASLGEKLESYLKSSGNNDPEIREALSNLKDCIDFIRSINQHNNFLQIPLLVNNNTATAKLYVFKEGKRNKRIDPEDATVVVALDLVSLGHLESMIRVKGKTVDASFRVEDKSIGTMIEKNIALLKEPLREKGYYLSPVRIISLEQPFSLLSLEAMINESGYEKIHFDMRV